MFLGELEKIFYKVKNQFSFDSVLKSWIEISTIGPSSSITNVNNLISILVRFVPLVIDHNPGYKS